MIVLADTSIRMDHFRRGDLRLAQYLDRGDVVMHPFVIGELVLGNVPKIAEVIEDLQTLPKAEVAGNEEVLRFISHRKLSGSAAVGLAPETLLWTRGRRLNAVAQSLSLAVEIRE
jgi:predicted nucleic acid-binding protein